MRVQPPSVLKGTRRGGRIIQNAPHEGTILRELYNLFQANKGIVIEGSFGHKRIERKIADLRDYYGLDIRKVRQRHWVLAGEWFGAKYVDYIANRLNKS